MADSTYIHQPLQNPQHQFRLLKLLPATDSDSPIITQLSTYSLPLRNETRSGRLRSHLQLPAYFAISYVCGSGSELEKTHHVFVDGKRFPVTANVFSALHTNRMFITTPFLGWIDCICISQTDLNERSQQILLMRDIYFRAALVLVWFGNGTSDSNKAMRFVNKLTNHPLLNKGNDAILELYKLETDEKAQGLKPSLTEKLRRTTLRQGYAGLMKAGLAATQLIVSTTDIALNLQASFQPSQQLHNPYNSENYASKHLETVVGSVQDTSTGNSQVDPSRLLDKDAIYARLRARKDIDYEKMGFWAKRREFYRENKLALVEKKAGTSHPQGSIQKSEYALTSGLKEPENRNSTAWQPSNQALELAKNDDLLEMAQLIQKTLVQGTKYFDRMWTLQEACVANVTTVQLGTAMLSELKALINVADFLNNTLGGKVIGMDNINQLRWINSEWIHHRRLPLQVIIFESRSRDCLDPRDHIYALSGLMAETPNILIEADYQRPVSEVYANATRFMIASGQSLELVLSRSCCTQSQDPVHGLPSWVPDFRHFGAFSPTTPLIDVSGRNSIFNASLSERPHIATVLANPTNLPQAWNLLSITGIQIASVRAISQKLSSETELDLTEVEAKWNQIATESHTWNSEDAKALHIASDLLKLYCALNQSTESTDSSHQPSDVTQYLISLTSEFYNLEDKPRQLLTQYLQTLICGRSSPTQRCSVEELETLMSQACIRNASCIGETALKTLYQAFKTGLIGRRLAILGPKNQAQQWLAAVPEDAQHQDLICILIGCTVPVVLRRVKDSGETRYQVVGECFVYGFMDGEALMFLDQSEREGKKVPGFDLI